MTIRFAVVLATQVRFATFVKIANFCVKNTRQWAALAHIFSLNLTAKRCLPEKPTPRPTPLRCH